VVAAQKRWTPVTREITCFETRLQLKVWKLDLRVVVFRKRVHHESRRNYQLDLFSPDDGHFEYSAVASNLALVPRALWDFMVGRGAQEKTFAELKREFALDAVPTNHYSANSAWQQLSILAHNLTIGFQLHSNLAAPKPRTAKRTYSYWLSSIKTLRFTIIKRAARVARIHGRRVLRFSHNPATQVLYDQVLDRFAT
jgi:Transposase DDE domain group 1